MNDMRMMRVISIDTAAVLQIALYMLERYRHQLGLVSGDPDCLHACSLYVSKAFIVLYVCRRLTHDHMLQNMAMRHPHSCTLSALRNSAALPALTRLRDTDSPSSPSHISARRRILCIFVQHCGIALREIESSNFLFVLDRVVGVIATAKVPVVRTMCVKGMYIDCEGLSACVEDFVRTS